jgi:hypothetical protein
MGMPALRVSHGQPGHEAGRVAVGAGPDREVEVVGHEAAGEQAHVLAVLGLGQDALEGRAIAVVLKDSAAGHGAIEDVVDDTAFGDSRVSDHVDKVTE